LIITDAGCLHQIFMLGWPVHARLQWIEGSEEQPFPSLVTLMSLGHGQSWEVVAVVKDVWLVSWTSGFYCSFNQPRHLNAPGTM
jgi:hypothetical protein